MSDHSKHTVLVAGCSECNAPEAITNRRARRNQRKATAAKADNGLTKAQQTDLAREVMDVVYDLARSAIRARARLRSEGYVVEPLPHEPTVYALLGMTAEETVPRLIEPPKRGLITVVGEKAKRLLS